MGKMTAHFLHITIHDNDFTGSLKVVGAALQHIFREEDEYPTEADLLALKQTIKHMWFGTHYTMQKLCWPQTELPSDFEYFTPTLAIVDYADIPDWDNDESIYVPLFKYADIIVR